MKILLLIFALTLFSTACSQEAANTNTSANVKASPTPTPTEEERAEQQKLAAEEKQKAIDEFVVKHYKGWKLEGLSGYLGECEEDSDDICDLLLSKGQEDKVVSVKIKHFTDQNGQSHLFVFEARLIDLSKAKIERLKEQEKDRTLENLTADEISESLKQDIIDNDAEEQAQRDYEPPDPY